MQTTVTIQMNENNAVLAHNQREEELCEHEAHIDLHAERCAGSFHETWYCSDVREKYEEIFGEALDEYNAKQKRKDRRMSIDDYMKSIENDGRGKRQTELRNGKRVVKENARQGKQLYYEITVAVGNTEREKDENGCVKYDGTNHHIRTEELPQELQRRAVKRYCDTFAERNKNFATISVEYHADEGFYNRRGAWERGISHAHIVYVPIAQGFKQGLYVQNSMNKALAAMGFGGENGYMLWHEREVQELNKILLEEYEIYCKEHADFYAEKGDLTIHTPVKDKNRMGGATKEQYVKEQELEEAIAEQQHFAKKIEKAFQQHADELNVFIDEVNERSEQQDKKEYELAAREKSLVARSDSVTRREQQLVRREADVAARENALNENEAAFAEREQTFTRSCNARMKAAERNAQKRASEIEEEIRKEYEAKVAREAAAALEHMDKAMRDAMKAQREMLQRRAEQLERSGNQFSKQVNQSLLIGNPLRK